MGSGSPGVAKLPGAMCSSAKAALSQLVRTGCQRGPEGHPLKSPEDTPWCLQLLWPPLKKTKSSCKPVLKSRHQTTDKGACLTTRGGE